MLRPHDGEDAQLNKIRLSAKCMEHAVIFFGTEAMCLNNFGCDRVSVLWHVSALSEQLWESLVPLRLTARAVPAKPLVMDQEAPKTDEMTFEQALKALEQVVQQLESGDVPLDDSIALYERGEKLRSLCQARLDSAQARIESIVAGPDGKPAGAEPFDAG